MTLMKELEVFFTQSFCLYTPFHLGVLQFCEDLSKLLFQTSNQEPEITALAFWLRKSHLNQMQKAFLEKKGHFSPRGIVFHIPPSNIDVMLVYSWITSLLVGNANIIRLPSLHNLKMELIFELLKKYPQIEKHNVFIRYGHELEITEWISSRVDARMIWGGDETIRKIREAPLQPHALDLAFPDRFSFAVIHAENYMKANKEEIANQFYNDVFSFDQSACSSPRAIFWVGPCAGPYAGLCEEASHIFYQKLQEVIKKREHTISVGGALLKKNYLFSQSLELPVQKVMEVSNELSVLFLIRVDPKCRIHPGQGLLYHIPIQHLNEIIPFVTHRDQTMTYYGFSREELEMFISALNGKGLTRFIPFGEALHFEPVWDGIDLFHALTTHQMVKI